MFTFSIRTEDEIRALSAAEVRDTIKAHLEDVLPDSFFEAHYDMKVVPIHEVEVLLQKERKLRGGSANNADPLCHFGLSHRLMCCPKKCECVYLILPRRLYVECFSLSLSHTHTMPHNHTHTRAHRQTVWRQRLRASSWGTKRVLRIGCAIRSRTASHECQDVVLVRA